LRHTLSAEFEIERDVRRTREQRNQGSAFREGGRRRSEGGDRARQLVDPRKTQSDIDIKSLRALGRFSRRSDLESDARVQASGRKRSHGDDTDWQSRSAQRDIENGDSLRKMPSRSRIQGGREPRLSVSTPGLPVVPRQSVGQDEAPRPARSARVSLRDASFAEPPPRQVRDSTSMGSGSLPSRAHVKFAAPPVITYHPPKWARFPIPRLEWPSDRGAVRRIQGLYSMCDALRQIQNPTASRRRSSTKKETRDVS
jgi:hypothetical protein